MTDYGVTSTGWVPKPVSQILTEVQAAQIAAIDPGLDVSAESLLSNLNGIMCAQFGSLWQLGGLCAAGQDPNSASFAQLAAVAMLTGTTPRGPTPGTVVLSVVLSTSTPLPAGSVAYVPGQPQNTWATNAPVGGAPGPYTVNATAVNPGAQAAAAGQITAMVPVSGWTSVSNALDAIPGQDAETDAQLRARRQAELAQGGGSSVPAIQAALADVANVVQVVVYENTRDTVSAQGLPPKSVMVLVDGGTDADVAAALFAAKGGGIQTYATGSGATSFTLTDANGQARVVCWVRPAPLRIFLTCAVDKDASTYAGDAAVTAAIVGYVTGLLAGQPLRLALCERAVLAVPGVIDCQVLAGTTATVGGLNVQVPPLQIANLNVSTDLALLPWSEGP